MNLKSDEGSSVKGKAVHIHICSAGWFTINKGLVQIAISDEVLKVICMLYLMNELYWRMKGWLVKNILASGLVFDMLCCAPDVL